MSGIASERLRSLVNRLRKEGWLEQSGRGKYQLGIFAITDVGVLIGAVKAGNQEVANTAKQDAPWSEQQTVTNTLAMKAPLAGMADDVLMAVDHRQT
ncbi:MAG: hypothetical protein KTV45_02875 [Acidimicrobiia bacterium]|nr:hypothetical protein [Acidimicrobiia bacterium]